MGVWDKPYLALWHFPEALSEQLKPRFIKGSHRLGQVPA